MSPRLRTSLVPSPVAAVRGAGRLAGALLRLDVTAIVTGIGRVPAVVDGAEQMLAEVGDLVSAIAGAVARADDLLVAIETATRQAGTVVDDAHGTVVRVEPLLARAERTLDALPPVLERLDREVVPSVRSLEGLVPTIESLSRQVAELNRVVCDVGDLLGGIPGAARLRRRSGRTADTPVA